MNTDLFGNPVTGPPPETTAQILTRHYQLDGGVQMYEFTLMGEATRRGWRATDMRDYARCVAEAEQFLLTLMDA